MQRLHLIIHGRVQGVCFRATAAEVAHRLQLTGWVRNLPAGTVELVAEGNRSQMAQLLDWCRHGPPSAHVTHVEETWQTATGEFPQFVIR